MLSFFLNSPYTLLGIVVAFLLGPTTVEWNKGRYAIIFTVKRGTVPFAYLRGWRGAAIGHSVILNPRVEDKDLEHELIHVDQYRKYPLIFPLLYHVEYLRKGYRNNRFEDEAYSKSGNAYHGEEKKIEEII